MSAEVAYVVPDLTRSGGIQTFARRAAQELSAANMYSVRLVDRTELAHRRLPSVLAEFAGAPSRRVLAGWAHSNQGLAADLTHFWHPADAWGQPVARYVVTCHGKDVLPSSPPQGWRYRAWRRGLVHASAITTPSHYTAEYLVAEHRVPAELVTVVHPAVGQRDLSERPGPGADDLGATTIRVGVLSRLEERKNVARCIDAAEILQDRLGTAVEFHLAGAGPAAGALGERLRSSRVASVSWGRISEVDKWERFLPALDVFLLPTLASPSDVEGFGIVYLEANSVGTPVVASAVGGVPDAVSDGMSGFFADPADPESIADAAARVVAAGPAMRSTAHAWSRQFAPAAMAERLDAVYRRALAA